MKINLQRLDIEAFIPSEQGSFIKMAAQFYFFFQYKKNMRDYNSSLYDSNKKVVPLLITMPNGDQNRGGVQTGIQR